MNPPFIREFSSAPSSPRMGASKDTSSSSSLISFKVHSYAQRTHKQHNGLRSGSSTCGQCDQSANRRPVERPRPPSSRVKEAKKKKNTTCTVTLVTASEARQGVVTRRKTCLPKKRAPLRILVQARTLAAEDLNVDTKYCRRYCH